MRTGGEIRPQESENQTRGTEEKQNSSKREPEVGNRTTRLYEHKKVTKTADKAGSGG